MKRLATYLALFVHIAGCAGFPDPASLTSDPPLDPRTVVVPTSSSGPGKFTFVNSDPRPGSTISGCGETVGGCQDRLKIVFALRPEVDLRSHRLHVWISSERQGEIECFSTGFDLGAGETFEIHVSCPSSPRGPATPLLATTMTVETGAGEARIEQRWNVTYEFLP